MMLNAWYTATMLAFEAGDVMRLRTVRIARGGVYAYEEIYIMVVEKIMAAIELLTPNQGGRTPMSAIERFRYLVAANASRLQ